ncbi:lytic murein transglycosylase [Lichenicoccus sp.]|uniref:lytic murein transglycosylase n=1 Tax=Lichenicoccus sp. TaxID=2781899 RepID=UPI003D12FB0D
MLDRRHLLAALAVLPAGGAFARSPAPGFAAFLATVRAQARRLGVSDAVLDGALTMDRPNASVLQRDRNQPEFTLTWARYRSLVLTPAKIDGARAAWQERLALLRAIRRHFPADPRVAVAIWGIESRYGSLCGTFGVVDALATLAYDGRRAGFFTAELLGALRILQQGDVTPGHMLGSYAGAMGQPQFMPSSFLRYAVDFDGDGRRNIWASDADVLASIANYLARNGWVAGAPWGEPARVPAGLAPIGRRVRRPLGAWMRLGVRRADGAGFRDPDRIGAIVAPDGLGGDVFMVYENFDVIRRYNPSDFYSLAVGLLGDTTA